jgi:hypothetical protein
MRRSLVVAVLALICLFGTAAPALASIGVGTDMRSIDVTQPLVAGGTYRIHSFTIINTGSEDSGFGILVSPTAKAGKTVPASWLAFQPSAFYLSPKRGLDVGASLHIPLDAAAGTYRVLLLGVPKLAGDLSPGGHMNVGVGPRLTFTVVQPNRWQWMYFLFLGWMPWSAIGVLVVVVFVAAAVLLAVWRARSRRASRESEDADDVSASSAEDDVIGA